MARTAESVNAVIKAYDVRGVVGEQIDAEFVRDVGASFARLVRDSGTAASQVVVGHDMRASSPDLSRAFADGVTSQGLDVVHIGLASTDQLYFASGLLDCPGAMFTAGHNPAKYNGIKLCRAGAKPVGHDTGLATIKAELVAGVPVHDGAKGSVSERDVLGEYAEFVRSLVDLSQVSGVKIAVDAGNGMGGHTVPAVFEGLPVTVEPLYFELDGTFPNHEANPLDPENLKDLQRFVRETGADIGLAFDGDADRCFVVDENGDPVSPSAVTGVPCRSWWQRWEEHRCARESATRSSSSKWPIPARSSVVSIQRTTISEISGARIRGCWPRCTYSPRWDPRIGRCPS